jgi:RNA polymerase sigma-70 factor (ECF subfamily)
MADAVQAEAVALAHSEELRVMLARRDERAAAWLFDTFEREVNRIVWTLLGADKEHDDVVHEAMCAVLKSAHRVADPDRLKGWVRVVTVNTVRLTLRKRRWLRLFGGLDEDSEGERFEALVPDEAQRETARRTYRALATLKPDERTALALRHIEEFELTEVADAMGCSLATIKRRLGKAEEKFQRAYKGAVDGNEG